MGARLRRWAMLLLSAGAATSAAAAETIAIDKVPVELRPFVEAGTKAIFVGSADLNGDGRSDYLLVLEKQKQRESDPDIEEAQRPLLIVIRQADGRLKLQKRSDRVVYCSRCGGMMGDPLDGVEVGPGSFAVSHYGGSAWRWSNRYQFAYSRRDDTWQLVRVDESAFHAGDPDHMTKKKVLVPPRHYGKIDIADFDPEHFLRPGSK
jgi:hypothetical protein